MLKNIFIKSSNCNVDMTIIAIFTEQKQHFLSVYYYLHKRKIAMSQHEELINDIHLARKRFEDSPKDTPVEEMNRLLDELEIMSIKLRALHNEHRKLSN